MPNIENVCYTSTTKTVNLLLTAKTIDASSPLTKLPFIGKLMAERLNALDIFNVGDVVKYFQRKSAKQIDKTLSDAFANPRKNTCVKKSKKPSYQVAFVNICAYNTIIDLLKNIHNMSIDDRVDLDFPRRVRLRAVLNMPFLQRGVEKGSRMCSCIVEDGKCKHNRNCRWSSKHSTCFPKVKRANIRNNRAGFRGRPLTKKKRGRRHVVYDAQYMPDDRNIITRSRHKGWLKPAHGGGKRKLEPSLSTQAKKVSKLRESGDMDFSFVM